LKLLNRKFRRTIRNIANRNSSILAGLAAGAIAWLASPSQAATGTIQDVQHVVIFMQENRSFDQYYGTLKGVRGFNDRNALVFTNGNTDFYQPRGTNYLLPFHITTKCVNDVDHGWSSGHTAWHAGKYDQWVPAKGTTAMTYYTRIELAFYYALADAYTVCDAYHCSVLGPTDPNRLYLWTGTIDADGKFGGPIIDNTEPPSGFTWTTYPERLQSAGVSWKVYQQLDNYDDNALFWFAQYKNAPMGSPLRVRGISYVTNVVTAFHSDVTNETLPQVSWIIAPTALSEHPPYSPASGAAWTKQLLDALAANPAVYNSTVFMLTYDENGGFFDHVPPPVPPPGTASEFVGGLPIGLGVRVPLVLVSPWTRGGYVCSQVFDHTSIIRFLETWTGVKEPNLSAWRRKVCGDLTSAFNFASLDTSYPSLPAVTPVSCSTGVTPIVPSPQTAPLQEIGAKPARPLPYQPNANSYTDCAAGRFYITMTNAGAASTHLMIYPNAYRTDGPWQYDVAAGNSVTDSFNVITLGAGQYDLTCYGPNGFQRRFAGNINTNCNQIEVTSSIDLNAGGITLAMLNSTPSDVSFAINANAYQTGGPWSYLVAAGSTVATSFPALTATDGWYDLTATASSDASFLRRIAGHIETGAPRLSAALSNGNLLLTYPSWASGFTVESSPDLTPQSWTAVNTTSNIVGNDTIVKLPPPPSPRFFRLRH